MSDNSFPLPIREKAAALANENTERSFFISAAEVLHTSTGIALCTVLMTGCEPYVDPLEGRLKAEAEEIVKLSQDVTWVTERFVIPILRRGWEMRGEVGE